MLEVRISIKADSIIDGLSLASSYALDAEINDMRVTSVSSENTSDQDFPYRFTLFVRDFDNLNEEQAAFHERVKDTAEAARRGQIAIDEIPF